MRTNSEVEKNCATCVYAVPLQSTGAGVCKKNNEIVLLSGCCRKYEQDLLKLKPRLPLLPDSGEDSSNRL